MVETATDKVSDNTVPKYQPPQGQQHTGCRTAEEGCPLNWGGSGKKGFLKEMTSELQPKGSVFVIQAGASGREE